MKKCGLRVFIHVFFFIAFLNVFSLNIASINAFATTVPDAPPTGTEVVYCDTAFKITDLTKGKANDFDVIFKDISLGKIYRFSFSQKNGFADNETHQILANTTYEITASGLGDEYVLTDKSGQKIEKTAATAAGLTLEWIIKEKNSQINYKVKRNAEGDAVYAEFIEAAKSLDTLFAGREPSWRDDARLWFSAEKDKRITESVLAHNICSQEHWNDIVNNYTKFEQYCWWTLYGQFVDYIYRKNPQEYFKSERSVGIYLESIKDNVNFRLSLNSEAYIAIRDAHYKVFLWQYHFFLENADFYDFTTGETYKKSNREVDLGEVIDDIEITKKQDEDFLKQFEEELSEEAQKANKAVDSLKDNAPPADNTPQKTTSSKPPEIAPPETEAPKKGMAKVLDSIKRNAVTFIIGILLVGGGWTANHFKNKKSKDEADEEDTDEDWEG